MNFSIIIILNYMSLCVSILSLRCPHAQMHTNSTRVIIQLTILNAPKCTTIQNTNPIVAVILQSSSGSRRVSHFIRIIQSETANPVFQKTTSVRPEEKSLSTFSRSLQLSLRRKSECLSEIISARVIHPM